MEQILTPTVNGNFKNLNLKTRYARNPDNSIKLVNGKREVIAQGLEDGNHIIVKKTKFAEGREIPRPTYTMYSCMVEYKGEDVSFLLYNNKSNPEHDNFKNCGGLDDELKITLNKEIKINGKTGAESLVDVLTFEKVEND